MPMPGPGTSQDAVFRDLVDSLHAVLWVAAPDCSSILYCSRAYEELWGRGTSELYANPGAWLDAVHPDDRALATAARERAAEGYDVEYRVVRPDGEIAHVHDRARPVRDAAGRLDRIAGITTDITAARWPDEQLLHAQKMESLGRLAGGVAHEVNNLLTIVLGQAALARERPATAAGHLERIEETARRGGELTARLLGLAPSRPLRSGPADLAAIARELAPALRELLGPDIRLDCSLDGGDLPVRAGAEQLRRLLLALAQNGADAMPGGGTLALAIAGKPGDRVVLTVSDTGAGIPEADRAHVFEPFFTTTPGAAGMGLTNCYGIVTRAGGQIRLESVPGRGTTVECSFPRAVAAAPAAPAGTPGRGERSETVLLAEDEPMVREIVGMTLRELGFDVIEAGDGAAALAAAATAPPVALLVTDVAMPRMDGRELAERLREQAPELRVLFVSGYSDAALGDAADPATAFLPKPFVAAELAAAVRGLLEAA